MTRFYFLFAHCRNNALLAGSSSPQPPPAPTDTRTASIWTQAGSRLPQRRAGAVRRRAPRSGWGRNGHDKCRIRSALPSALRDVCAEAHRLRIVGCSWLFLLLLGPPGCGWDSKPSLPPGLLPLSACAPAILHRCWLCTTPSRSLTQGLSAERGWVFFGGIKNPRMFPCREKVFEAAPRAQRRNPSRKVHKVDDAGEEENALEAALHRWAFSALPMVSVYRIKQ